MMCDRFVRMGEHVADFICVADDKRLPDSAPGRLVKSPNPDSCVGFAL